MRVLAWPLYTLPGLPQADSGYIVYRNLIRAVPEWDWQVIVPKWLYDKGLFADDLDDLPNVVKVPVEMSNLHRVQEITVNEDAVWKYAPQIGMNPVDVVIAGSNQIASTLINAYSLRILEKNRPLIVAWDLMTRDDNQMGWRADEVELLAHFTGAASADVNVFGSEMMRWMTNRMLVKQFAPAVVREVMQNRAETVYAGVPTQRIAKTIEGIKKRDKFTVFYGGRLGVVKRVDELTEIADLAFQFGRDIGMVVCTGSLGPTRHARFKEKYPMVELHIGTGQEEAWRLMAECHAGFMWSKHEMIGSMFIEQMSAGMPVISSPHRWIESLLPPEYPYWAEDAKIAGAHLRLLYEAWQKDPETYADPMVPWAKFVRENHDSDVAGRKFQRIVEERLTAQRGGVPIPEGREGDAIIEFTGQVLEEGMTFPELVEAIRSRAAKSEQIIGYSFKRARSNAMIKAYHAARLHGWRTVGPGEDFTFTKKEQPDV